MKTIGLIGGISPESTAVYYRHLNQMACDRLGGQHSAQLLLWSLDFGEIVSLQQSGDWETAAGLMTQAARALERGGAQCIVICANTMHKMADEVQRSVNIPLIHIADATAAAIKSSHARHPLLLATRYTMEQDFYTGRLLEKHGIAARIPNDEDRNTVHDVIYHELCNGVVNPASKTRYLSIIERCREEGADSIILGCTEVCMLIGQDDFDCPVFDTAEIHARAAMEFAFSSTTMGTSRSPTLDL